MSRNPLCSRIVPASAKRIRMGKVAPIDADSNEITSCVLFMAYFIAASPIPTFDCVSKRCHCCICSCSISGISHILGPVR